MTNASRITPTIMDGILNFCMSGELGAKLFSFTSRYSFTYKLYSVQKGILFAASLAGLLAVVLGAFGAHALRASLTPEQLNIWEKGVQYQMYHALALFGCAVYTRTHASSLLTKAALCFVLGILCFSGSLYLLATRDITGIPTNFIGPVTPIGGLFFIAGWALILTQALRKE